MQAVPDDMTYNKRGPLLSASDADYALAWRRVEQLRAHCASERDSFEVSVVDYNSGGLIAALVGLKAFIPWSSMVRTRGQRWDRDGAMELLGSRLAVTLVEASKEERKLTLSPRAAALNRALARLVPGTLVHGTVAKVMPYGVFVEMDGTGRLQGLLHKSNISVQQFGRHEVRRVVWGVSGSRGSCRVWGLPGSGRPRQGLGRALLCSVHHRGARATPHHGVGAGALGALEEHAAG